MEGQGPLEHDVGVQRRKAGAAGGEKALFPRVLMQQGITHRRRSGGEGEGETAGRARERLGSFKIQLPATGNGDTRDTAHSTAPRPRTGAERTTRSGNLPFPGQEAPAARQERVAGREARKTLRR